MGRFWIGKRRTGFSMGVSTGIHGHIYGIISGKISEIDGKTPWDFTDGLVAYL